MKGFLLSTLSSNKGRLITWAASLATGLLSGQVAKWGWELDATTQASLTATITSVLGAGVDGWTNYQTAKGVKRIQTALQLVVPGIKRDSWAGNDTATAVEGLVAAKLSSEQLMHEVDAAALGAKP